MVDPNSKKVTPVIPDPPEHPRPVEREDTPADGGSLGGTITGPDPGPDTTETGGI